MPKELQLHETDCIWLALVFLSSSTPHSEALETWLMRLILKQ